MEGTGYYFAIIRKPLLNHVCDSVISKWSDECRVSEFSVSPIQVLPRRGSGRAATLERAKGSESINNRVCLCVLNCMRESSNNFETSECRCVTRNGFELVSVLRYFHWNS